MSFVGDCSALISYPTAIHLAHHKYTGCLSDSLSELVLHSEWLNRALEGRHLDSHQLTEVYDEAALDADDLMRAAEHLCHTHKGNVVSFSKKAFLNVINMCRDTCTYCTYKAEPSQDKLSMMNTKAASAVLETARRYGCVEALLVGGERPEERYPEARRWLRQQGFSSTPQYMAHISSMALDAGLFPHTNTGNLEGSELSELASTNVSLGIMLENISERLAERGMPHYLAPSKLPARRMDTIREAGRLRIPITTGILIGIGETPIEAIDSLLAIDQMHRRYGHVQEIIIQNFQPKPDTAMRQIPPARHQYTAILAAMARIIMPDMNIQVPPNLSPDTYHTYLESGINDWGGISPFTPDYVNPEFAWPNIIDLERECNSRGFSLRCRFPVYPGFAHMTPTVLQDKMRSISDPDGYVQEGYWR